MGGGIRMKEELRGERNQQDRRVKKPRKGGGGGLWRKGGKGALGLLSCAFLLCCTWLLRGTVHGTSACHPGGRAGRLS